jgi:hypothetical protein
MAALLRERIRPVGEPIYIQTAIMDTLPSYLRQKIVDKLKLYPETLCSVAQVSKDLNKCVDPGEIWYFTYHPFCHKCCLCHNGPVSWCK